MATMTVPAPVHSASSPIAEALTNLSTNPDPTNLPSNTDTTNLPSNTDTTNLPSNTSSTNLRAPTKHGVPTFQEFYTESLNITPANKGTIIDIFDIIKTRTGKSYKDIRGESEELVVLRAQKLLIALFIRYQLNVFLLCFYLKLGPAQIDELWRAFKKDISLQREVELTHAIICGRIMGITEPEEGIVIFIAHIHQWFGNIGTNQRIDLRAYVEGTLTNTKIRIDQMSAVRGLYFISQHPKIRSQLIHYLSISGLSNYVGLIEPQIRRAGYALVPQ